MTDICASPVVNLDEDTEELMDLTVDNPVIIKLIGDKPFVWKAEDWLKLNQFKISGYLAGVPANFSRQVGENGLPMQLMPEEVSLILEHKIGKVYKNKTIKFTEKVKKGYEEYINNNREEQVNYYKEVCRGQVIERIDSIIEGKRRKLLAKIKKENPDNISEPEIDKESLIETEFERRMSASTSSLLMQIPTCSPFFTEDDLEPVEWDFPKTPLEKIRYLVYKDLYERDYFITRGTKFGGDFLVYPGQPFKFHAFFIIKCLELNEELKCTDLIIYARVGVFTKKNLVLASVDGDGHVFYNTFSWPGKN